MPARGRFQIGQVVNVRCSPCASRKQPVRFPEEFRAPKAYESRGGTNPRWAGFGLWGFEFVVDAGTGAAVAAACWPTRFVAVAVHGVPVLRAAMMADNEHWSVADENGRDIG
jgi:hypothetical protein